MDHKKLFKQLFFLILLISILNFAANTFYWYYSIWYFDMIMHFFGGVWLGLFYLWLFFSREFSFRILFQTLLFTLVIGICWEIFEFYFINHIASNPFNILDTISDLFFDLVGGAFAILYFTKNIMLKLENEVR